MSSDTSSLRRADRVIAAGALGLLIALFLFKWYGVAPNVPTHGANLQISMNGWHTFTSSRWIWLITIVAALGSVALRLGGSGAGGSTASGAVVALLGGLSALLILYRIIDHPLAAQLGPGAGQVAYGIKLGIYLGLLAALTIAWGGWLALGEARVPGGNASAGAEERFTGLLRPERAPQSERTAEPEPAPQPEPASRPERPARTVRGGPGSRRPPTDAAPGARPGGGGPSAAGA